MLYLQVSLSILFLSLVLVMHVCEYIGMYEGVETLWWPYCEESISGMFMIIFDVLGVTLRLQVSNVISSLFTIYTSSAVLSVKRQNLYFVSILSFNRHLLLIPSHLY